MENPSPLFCSVLRLINVFGPEPDLRHGMVLSLILDSTFRRISEGFSWLAFGEQMPVKESVPIPFHAYSSELMNGVDRHEKFKSARCIMRLEAAVINGIK
jgi:hypothetical protein